MTELKPFPYDKISNDVLECLLKKQNNIDNDENEDIQTDSTEINLHKLILVYMWEAGIEIPDILLDKLPDYRLRALVRAMVTVIYAGRSGSIFLPTKNDLEIPKKLLDFVLNDIEQNETFYIADADYYYDPTINAFGGTESFDLCKYLADKGYYSKSLFKRLCNTYEVGQFDIWVIYCKLVKLNFFNIPMINVDLSDLKNIIETFITKYKLPFDAYPDDFLERVSRSETAGAYFIRLLKRSYKEEDIPEDFFDKIGITWDLTRTADDYEYYEDNGDTDFNE
ncbi:MAG: hypothetical protein WCO84_06095 [bacterium]